MLISLCDDAFNCQHVKYKVSLLLCEYGAVKTLRGMEIKLQAFLP